jgi:hypothetical protein
MNNDENKQTLEGLYDKLEKMEIVTKQIENISKQMSAINDEDKNMNKNEILKKYFKNVIKIINEVGIRNELKLILIKITIETILNNIEFDDNDKLEKLLEMCDIKLNDEELNILKKSLLMDATEIIDNEDFINSQEKKLLDKF